MDVHNFQYISTERKRIRYKTSKGDEVSAGT